MGEEIKIKKNPEKPETKEILAEAIMRISESNACVKNRDLFNT